MRTETLLARLALVVFLAGASLPAHAAGEATTPPAQNWSFNGFAGIFDRSASQRGFQVYKEVCSTCHAMSLLSYRNLEQLGFSEEDVAAIAAQYTVTDGPDDNGEMFERRARPSDRFFSPYPNEQAARAANNGAYPPDLSVMTKARPNGANYMYAFLVGFEEPPAGEELMPGMFWNEYFPGHQVAMPNILIEDGVTYADGTAATVAQQAWDVTNFLMWAAEPHMEARKEMGLKVVLFLIVFTGLMYAIKRKIWADVH